MEDNMDEVNLNDTPTPVTTNPSELFQSAEENGVETNSMSISLEDVFEPDASRQKRDPDGLSSESRGQLDSDVTFENVRQSMMVSIDRGLAGPPDGEPLPTISGTAIITAGVDCLKLDRDKEDKPFKNSGFDKGGSEVILDDPIGTMCFICDAAGEQRVASTYCISCGCMTCTRCSKTHVQHSPDNEHVMVDITEDTAHSVYCKTHTDQPVRIFCLSCNTAICKVCLAEQHGQHKMSDLTSSQRTEKTLIAGIKTQVKNHLKELRIQKRDLGKARVETEQNRNATNAAVVSHIEKQIKFLQDRKSSLVEKSNKFHAKVTDGLLGMEKLVDKATGVVVDIQTRVDKCEYPLPPHQNVFPELFPTQLIQKMFTKVGLPSLEARDFGTDECYFSPGLQVNPGELHVGRSVLRRTLPHIDDDDMKSRKVQALWNKRVEVHDVHFLPNRSKDLLCTDINKGYTLHKLNRDGKLAALPSGLSGFSGRDCVMGINQITGYKVIGYKPENKANNIILSILTDEVDGVDVNLIGATLPPGYNMMVSAAVSQSNTIVLVAVDDEEDPKRTGLCCYNTRGRMLWHRNTSPTHQAGDLEFPGFLIIDQLDRIIVSDVEGYKVNIYSNDGSHLVSFPERRKLGVPAKPTGLCLDSTGRMLVSFLDLQVVALFTANGEFIRHLVQTEGPPWGISLCDDRFLAVALEGHGLWMYDLKQLD